MAWNDSPPTTQELASAKPSQGWDSSPPTPEELTAATTASEVTKPNRAELWRRLSSPTPEEEAADKKSSLDAVKRQDEQSATSRDATLDSLLFGHLPQVKAKLGQIFSGEGISNDSDYLKRRDDEIAHEKEMAEKYPGSHVTGKIAGMAIPMVATMGMGAPAVGAAEAAPLAVEGGEAVAQGAAQVGKGLLRNIAEKTARGALTAGAMGAAQNPGDEKGVVDPIQIDGRLANAKTAAKVGGALGFAAAAVPAMAEAAGNVANTKAFKAAGAMLKDFRKASERGNIEETGQFMFDNGLVKAGDTYATVGEKAEKLREETGNEIGKGYEAAKKILPTLGEDASARVEAAGFNPVRDKGEILQAVNQQLKNSPERKSVLSHISNYLDDLAEDHGDQVLNPQATNQIKSKLDQVAINWERNPMAREPEKEAGYKALRQYLGNKVSDQVDQIGKEIGNPEAASNLAALNKKYGMASKIASIANDRAGREEAKSAFGLGHMGATGIGTAVGTAVGGPIGAALGAGTGYVANTVGAKYGPALIASGAKTAANAMTGIPEIIQSLLKNPQAVSLLKNEMAKAEASPMLARPSNELDGDSSRSSNYQDHSGEKDMKSQPKPMPQPAPKPKKGTDKWAADGADNIAQHDPEHGLDMDAAMADPKSKALLIAASDMKPGGKAMGEILAKLKAKRAKN